MLYPSLTYQTSPNMFPFSLLRNVSTVYLILETIDNLSDLYLRNVFFSSFESLVRETLDPIFSDLIKQRNSDLKSLNMYNIK